MRRFGSTANTSESRKSVKIGTPFSITGTNTPLKIYSYLRSGKPIVATNLLTHTQVLTPDIAKLVEPKPGPFAAAGTDPAHYMDAKLMVERLAERKVYVDSRPVAGLRVSPHFFNTDEEIEEALNILAELMA